MDKFIPLSVPNFIGNEEKYALEAIKAGWVSTGGALIDKFESNIAEYVGASNAVACQSGTSGLHLSLLALAVDKECHVIAPTLTFIAAVNPIVYCNAEPIFIDCDDSLSMDMDKLDKFLSTMCYMKGGDCYCTATDKRIAAVVAVHVFGNMCNMSKLMRIKAKYNFKVLEDATEALGTYYINGEFVGKHSGTIGDIGVYSFNGNKIITTGGGGMIVTNDKKSADYIKYLSTQAKDDSIKFIHNEIGYNYRMTNVQAGLGVAQLETLEQFVKVKNENYDRYIRNSIKLLPFDSCLRANKWFYSYLAKNISDRDRMIDYMTAQNIQTRPIWALIHSLPMYTNCIAFEIEKAYYYHERVVNIPCSTSLTSAEVDIIAGVIKEYV